MNIELLNAIIAACTSIFVVILSQLLMRNSKNRQVLYEEKNNFQKVYINPIRFILSENYYRIYEILEHSDKRESILVVNKPIEVLEKDMDWFIMDGCYLMSSCYLAACLFAYMESIRNVEMSKTH